MKKAVAVKKNKNYIYAIRVMSALFLLAAVFIAAALWENSVYAILLCGIFLFPVLVLEIYCETWQISFGEKIVVKTFLFSHTYEWRELSETQKFYSLSSNGERIVMIFKNGKSISFTGNDENAEKAEKIILIHCNIKTQT